MLVLSRIPTRIALVAALLLCALRPTRADFFENFDGVAAPALPAGWSSSTWFTTADTPDSPPNSGRATSSAGVSDLNLDSPSISIVSVAAVLSFRHRFVLEGASGSPPLVGMDGGVLEIAIGGAAFQDILAAGAQFQAGGYTHTISTQTSSPIGGRQAWSGNDDSYFTTSVRLPASAANSTVRFRFRLASDQSNGGGFWAIDTISLIDDCVASDTVAPTLDCPDQFNVPQSCDGNNVIPDLVSVVPASDNCPATPAVTQDPPPGTPYPAGDTPLVTFTATDAAGNTSQCAAVVVPTAQCGACQPCGTLGAGMFATPALLVGMKLRGRRSANRR